MIDFGFDLSGIDGSFNGVGGGSDISINGDSVESFISL